MATYVWTEKFMSTRECRVEADSIAEAQAMRDRGDFEEHEIDFHSYEVVSDLTEESTTPEQQL